VLALNRDPPNLCLQSGVARITGMSHWHAVPFSLADAVLETKLPTGACHLYTVWLSAHICYYQCHPFAESFKPLTTRAVCTSACSAIEATGWDQPKQKVPRCHLPPSSWESNLAISEPFPFLHGTLPPSWCCRHCMYEVYPFISRSLSTATVLDPFATSLKLRKDGETWP
jgi:hypothetical protein